MRFDLMNVTIQRAQHIHRNIHIVDNTKPITLAKAIASEPMKRTAAIHGKSRPIIRSCPANGIWKQEPEASKPHTSA